MKYPVRQPEPLHQGADAFVNGAIGRWRRRDALRRQLHEQARRIDQLASSISSLTDAQLREEISVKSVDFRRRLHVSEEHLAQTIALLREAAHRRLGLRAYLAQIMGVLALHRGCLAEMATGEGKTLTAGLAAVLAGFTGRPCHVITVNDYLVERDAKWIKPLLEFCGLGVGAVTAAMPPEERRAAYAANVTYVTSKEALADFLRDRLRLGALAHPSRQLVRQLLRPGTDFSSAVLMRGLHTAIVDEADSILIDEAVTPLIISAERENRALAGMVSEARELAQNLHAEDHYRIDLRYRAIEFTKAGEAHLAELGQRQGGLWRREKHRLEWVKQALVAREFFHRGKQYLIEDGKIVIVDEFTGRPMEQRSWTQGLHQAIEAKEAVNITPPKETVARMSFQRFFRSYHQLSGMTGTAAEAADEVWQVYGLPVVRIPTNRPCVRQVLPDRFFPTEQEKWRAIVQEIGRIHATGRPVLIGTRSVAASEHLAELLRQAGLEFDLLNATRLKAEADVVAMAGGKGRITIATNMAGRGTDIKLGDGVAELGGLHVIATERHESGRIDRQLFGRCARQGDPGTAQAFVSMEDDLLRKHLTRAERGLLGRAASLHRAAIRKAQGRAQALAYKQRKTVLRGDTWLDEALSFTGGGQ